MIEVDLVNGSNLAVEAYKEAYTKRYGSPPLLEGESRMPLYLFLRKVVRQYGLEKTMGLLSFFLKSNGNRDWWLNCGHSAKCLESDFAAIHAAFCVHQDKRRGALAASANIEIVDQKIAFITRCYQCQQDFEIVCLGSEMGDKAHLTLCRACEQQVA